MSSMVTSSTDDEEARDEAERQQLVIAASGEAVVPDVPRARRGHGGSRLHTDNSNLSKIVAIEN